MKIIDLLNKIANGEDVPKRIAYIPLDGCKYILKYDEIEKNYVDEDEEWLFDSAYDISRHLNDEVEILDITLNTKDMNITSSEIKPSTYTIEKLELPSFEEFKNMSAEERYLVTAKEYYVLDKIIDKINGE